MIFSDTYLQELREIGVNSQNLKTMIINVAVRCSELEKELKNGSDTKGNTESADKIGSSG